MAREVKLPEIGESVTEGTIIQWLVEEGDHVDEDQPILEISTDKIDTEVPSPAAGVLKEKKVQEDETVEVGQVLAIIADEDEADADAGGDEDDEASAEAEEAEAAAEADEEDAADEEEDREAAAEAEEDQADEDEDREAAAEAEEDQADEDEDREAAAEADQQEAEAEAEEAAEDAGDEAQEEDRRDRERQPAAQDNGQRADTDGEAREKGQLVSPIVRRMIEENDLDPSQIEGTGRGGRITREDVEQAIESGGTQQREAEPTERRQEDGQRGGQPEKIAELAPAAQRPAHIEERQRTENLSRIRKAIARHMMESLQSTAQLTATVEVDMTRVIRLRDRVKDEFRHREGVPLTPLPFIARAVCLTLPNHEKLNASINVDEGTATFYGFVNLGIAVDTVEGLIVPNIKGADDLTVPGLARSISDIADRARNRELHPDEIAGGTFTITNTGSRGVLFDTPIINPPQVAILATPRIEKRPIVVESADFGDSIAIRYMNYLCLTYDHRLIDGADAARFLAEMKTVLEEHDFSDEVGAGR